jgi:Na+/H+ antiporter NhaD/arsenite permease-like protein
MSSNGLDSDLILAVFIVTYIGMAIGRFPGLRIDRTGIALLGAIVLVAVGAVELGDTARFVDLPTILLLFGLMILSAQYGASGFYDGVSAAIARVAGKPTHLLAVTILTAGGLSAVLANDIVVFAMTPLLCVGLQRRGMNPVPFLIALACAANAGSAATIIGNPQNILLGQVGRLDFARFLAYCAVPAIAAMAVTFAVVAWQWRGRWQLDKPPGPTGMAEPPGIVGTAETPVMAPLFRDRVQFVKAIAATAVLLVLFFTDVPREISALAIAGALLASRKVASREIIGGVDFNLLLLFIALFVVTGAFAATPFAEQTFVSLTQGGLLPDRLAVLTPLALALSNTIGNVPAVILLLQVWHEPPAGALYALALLSTLAGNFLIVGSLANIITVERAASVGVHLSFGDHAKAGVPVTLISMTIAAAWLWGTGALRL